MKQSVNTSSNNRCSFQEAVRIHQWTVHYPTTSSLPGYVRSIHSTREGCGHNLFRLQEMVPHKQLIAKLEAYGIRGKVLKWIEEFLSGREQYVIVNGEKSSSGCVTSGIPQGTVLGPLLFVVYINDILENVTSEGFLFADDTKLFHAITLKERRSSLPI